MLGTAHSLNDTIVACATARGAGAIAIVRMSGPRALEIGRLLAPAMGAVRASHQLNRAKLMDGEGQLLDDAMLVEMHAPRSYTGENCVELYVHGSPAIINKVSERAIVLGARLAGPGEFTMRAFLNGKCDLMQAEAVADLIASSSDAEARAASQLLEGRVSRQIEAILNRLEAILADWRAALDFPEYPTGEGLQSEHQAQLEQIETELGSMLSRARINLRGKRTIVIAGAPNTGKSTLLNHVVGEERVLVDETAGTTRDPVVVDYQATGNAFYLCDTAGIREEAEGLEARGIQMSWDRIRRADRCIWLITTDSKRLPPPDVQAVIVGSKVDAVTLEARSELEDFVLAHGFKLWGWISPQTGAGVDALFEFVTASADAHSERDDFVTLRERHALALDRAHGHLGSLCEAMKAEASLIPLDMMARDLELATRALGEMIGRNVDLDVLNRIFSTFCIGK